MAFEAVGFEEGLDCGGERGGVVLRGAGGRGEGEAECSDDAGDACGASPRCGVSWWGGLLHTRVASRDWIGELVAVTCWVLEMPFPSGGDDGLRVLECGGPAEFFVDEGGVGDEACGIAGAARHFANGDFAARDFFADVDDFANAGSASGPEVVAGGFWAAEGEHMGLCEVEDVDVVADTGAVGRGVVGSEDGDVRFLSERDFEHVWDEMGFDAVIFAEAIGGACGVEVAKGDAAESVDFVVPTEDFFELEFGFAVRVDGGLRGGFGDGHGFWDAEGCAGGGEDHFEDTGGDHGFEEVNAAGDIVSEVLGGVGHGFADECVGSEVHDGVWAGGEERLSDLLWGEEIADDEGGARVDGGLMSFG